MKVFVSYRRSDTQDLAGRLVDRLRRVPEISELFFDVETIAPGARFPAAIRNALAKRPVFLALIGKDWAGKSDEGAYRIFASEDFVRQEVETALAEECRILPILVNGTGMPSKGDLPDSIKALCDHNAISLRHANFEQDCDLLIYSVLEKKQPGAIYSYLRRHPFQADVLRAILGFVTAAAFLILGAVLHSVLLRQPLEVTLGSTGAVWALIIGALSIGTMAGFFARPKWRHSKQ